MVGPTFKTALSWTTACRYLTDARTTLVYDMPLAEVVTDFFDELKSRSKGYASMDYEMTGFRRNDLVKLDVFINGEIADPLSLVCHRDAAYGTGKALVKKLKELIPRQMFKAREAGWGTHMWGVCDVGVCGGMGLCGCVRV